MPTLRPLAFLAAVSLHGLPLAASAADHHGARVHVSDDCTIEQGPNDRVSRGRPLVVEEGGQVDEAVALNAGVTVRRGAVVSKVVAVGGSIRIEAGATVLEDVVAVGGDVRVERGARVGKDAVALGGRLEVAEGAEVAGSRFGLDLTLGQDWKRELLAELRLDRCEIVPVAD